jgi:hypothetical protein
MADKRSEYSAFRLKKENVKYLQDMKRAFEIAYAKEFTNDEFIQQLGASLEAGDSAVWTVFCKLQLTEKELARVAAEVREKRGDSTA